MIRISRAMNHVTIKRWASALKYWWCWKLRCSHKMGSKWWQLAWSMSLAFRAGIPNSYVYALTQTKMWTCGISQKKGMLNVILNSYQISKLSLHSVIKCIDYFGLFLKGGYYLDELYGTYMLENVKIKAN